MSNFVILADGTCDLEEALQEKYNIKTIMGFVVYPDKSEHRAAINWDEQPREEFYAALKKNPMGFSTSPANVAMFVDAFEAYAKEGKDVLCMTLSSALSGAFDFASQAAEKVSASYPNVKIKCVDSRRFGPGFGLIAVYASILREEGKNIDEVYEWIESNKNRFHQAGWLDDLSFVAKKGRLTNAKAFFGTLAGVKPIGEFDYNGLTTVIAKAKGAKKALAALVEYVSETIENPEDQVIFIAQSNRYEFAVQYKSMLEERLHPKEVVIKDLYPSCGVNVGPGLMAAYYVGKPISEGLKEETAIIEKYLNA